jgi:hypothetical protein
MGRINWASQQIGPKANDSQLPSRIPLELVKGRLPNYYDTHPTSDSSIIMARTSRSRVG